MQTKYNALEGRSKELLLSQGSAVSGASVALSGLGNRLELLVDQLISSYNISEQDLEVSHADDCLPVDIVNVIETVGEWMGLSHC